MDAYWALAIAIGIIGALATAIWTAHIALDRAFQKRVSKFLAKHFPEHWIDGDGG